MSRFFRNPVILDTGPLVFLLIGLYDQSKKNVKDIWQGRSQKELELLLKLIKPFKSIVITPQILLEATHLLKRDTTSDKYRFLLAQIIKPLKEYGEVYIEKNIILDYPEFSKLGLTDIGIMECSKRMDSLIITEDSNLTRYCHPKKIPCVNFNNLKPSVWE